MQRQCPRPLGHETLAESPIARMQTHRGRERRGDRQREREREIEGDEGVGQSMLGSWKAHSGNAAFAPFGSMQNSRRFIDFRVLRSL